MSKILKTLTLKNIGIKLKTGAIAEDGTNMLGKAVMAINGICTGYFIKTTNFGESVALVGEFNAVNPVTGEVFMASTAYLPADFSAMVAKKLDARKDQSEIVEFSAAVTPVESEKSATKYTYVVEPIQTAEVYNRRAAMLEKLQAQVAQLPAAARVAQIAAPTPEKAKKSA